MQFAHRYIHKTPTDIVISGNQVGTAAHFVLEFRAGGMAEEDAVKTALEKVPLTENEQETLSSFRETIEAFLRRFNDFCTREGVTEVLREAEWGITATGAPTTFSAPDVYFRGKVDLAAVTRNKDLIVVDHKSGMARDVRTNSKFRAQLNSYAVLACATRPELAGVRGGIHFLQGAEAQKLQWLDYVSAAQVKRALTPWLFEYLNGVAEHLVAPFEGRPKAKWPCAWCSYTPVCTAYAEMVRGA